VIYCKEWYGNGGQSKKNKFECFVCERESDLKFSRYYVWCMEDWYEDNQRWIENFGDENIDYNWWRIDQESYESGSKSFSTFTDLKHHWTWDWWINCSSVQIFWIL